MIDPSKITKYGQTTEELQESILFWILAAGKNGTRAAHCLNAWMATLHHDLDWPQIAPFAAILASTDLDLAKLAAQLANHKTGAQTLKARTIKLLISANFDLQHCTRAELCQIWGIKLKTASCFILHSRPGCTYAGIDTHCKKFLRAHGVPVNGKSLSLTQYLSLEPEFTRIASQLGLSNAQLDLEMWNHYKHDKTT